MAKKGLGKGLSALLPDAAVFEEAQAGERVEQLAAVSLHANPQQPRKEFDEEKLAELALSIQEHGIMQPLIVVADTEQGGYMIVAGERRFRAAQQAGLSDLPCIVRQLTHSQLAELSLLENIQREDLSALEEAEGFAALMDSCGYTQEQLAQRLGKSRSYVANTLRLLKLAPQERRLLAEGRISAGHARALLSLEDVRQRARLAEAIERQDLSVRQAEQLAQQLKQETAPAQPRPLDRRQLIHQDIARRFSSRLGVKTRIEGKEGRGRVILEYGSEDDLQNIIDAILGQADF